MIFPKRFKVATDFAIQVVSGSITFAVVFLVAIAVSRLIHVCEIAGWVTPRIKEGADLVEEAVWITDLSCYALLILYEALKFVRALWQEFREPHG